MRLVDFEVPFPLLFFLLDDREIDTSGAGGVERADLGVGCGSSALSDSTMRSASDNITTM